MKQKADEIRGRADAEVIKMTAEAYGKNFEFFAFMQQLEMYKAALSKDTNLILSTNSDMFRLFKSIDPKSPPVPVEIGADEETEANAVLDIPEQE